MIKHAAADGENQPRSASHLTFSSHPGLYLSQSSSKPNVICFNYIQLNMPVGFCYFSSENKDGFDLFKV